MPAGKAARTGGRGAWARPVPNGVSISSMRRHAKRRQQRLTEAELKDLREKLRFPFKLYSIERAQKQPTASEQRRTLRKIKTAARRFQAKPNGQQADKLLAHLEGLDASATAALRYRCGIAGRAWVCFKRDLRDVYARFAAPDRCLGIAATLASINVDSIAPTGGRWPDPALARLVTMLVPVWKKVTGRTASLTSADKEGGRKTCRFAVWLGEMHVVMGLPPPPVGRVVDIVRAKRKNPAPY